jgi:hypothetical protein
MLSEKRRRSIYWRIQSFAVCIFVMYEAGIGRCDPPENEVLFREPEGCKHDIALCLEGSRCASLGAAMLPSQRNAMGVTIHHPNDLRLAVPPSWDWHIMTFCANAS